MNRTNLILLLILMLAVIFRFHRLWDFQYWSIDEEIFSAVVRKVAIEHQSILLSPNVAIGASLGSFFHLLSAPVFLLASMTASKILIAGSILGVATTFVVHKAGKDMFGKKVGQFAGILYASSFLMAFSDRRWWPLTLDPLLATLSVLSVYKIAINKNYWYSLPLAISMCFAWHADPSLAVIIVFSLLAFIVFRLPLFKKEYLPAVIVLMLSISPFLIFEFRHQGAVSGPIINLLGRLIGGGENSKQVTVNLLPLIEGFARSLGITPGNSIEKYFLYLKSYPKPFLSPVLELVAVTILLAPIFKIRTVPGLKILYLYLASFLIGILTFTLGMGSEFHQHYFVIIWPIFFLLGAYLLSKIPLKLALVLLFLFVLQNSVTLAKSSMLHPLFKKEILANAAMEKVKSENFALIVKGDRMFEGFGGIFFLKNRFPANKDYYSAWDWVFQSYSLYKIPVHNGPFDQKIVLSPKGAMIQ